MKNESFKFFFFVVVIDVGPQWVVCMERNLLKRAWKEAVSISQDIPQQHEGSSHMIQLSSSFLCDASATVGREELGLSFPKLIDLIVCSSTELPQAHIWILQGEQLGWCWGSSGARLPAQPPALTWSTPQGQQQSGGLCTAPGRPKGTIFQQTEEQEMNGLS